jgi:integrase/recombinase XerD
MTTSDTTPPHDLEIVAPGDNALAAPLRLQDWVRRETTSAFADVMTHFLLHCQSPHTRRNYARDLNSFLDFSGDLQCPVKDIADVNEKLALLWQEELKRRHTQYQGSRRRVVQTSVARTLSALSSLLDFAVKRKLVETNCLRLIPRPKIKRESKTNALTIDELKLLLDTAAEQVEATRGGKELHYRSARLQYTLIYTLLSVGMRVDELCELRIGDFEETSDFARLHMTAKGGETHSPIVHTNTARILRAFINEFRSQAGTGDFLFVRAHKVRAPGKMTQTSIYRMITQLAHKAGIAKHLSPHSCRATLATVLHNKGVPIGHIQELLNHKQITTTAIYIKKAQELEESAATKVDLLNLD